MIYLNAISKKIRGKKSVLLFKSIILIENMYTYISPPG